MFRPLLCSLLFLSFVVFAVVGANVGPGRYSARLSFADEPVRAPKKYPHVAASSGACSNSSGKILFCDDFDSFDLSVWKHDITLAGGGNWEFQYYSNNRSNSYVRNSTLFMKPTLTSDKIGDANVLNGYTMDMWGLDPPSQCTGNAFYGCFRQSNGANIINPIQSALVRTIDSFSGTNFRVEIRAKLPVGDWIWPAIWLLPKHNFYGDWPASGEIDIMESRGNSPAYSPGGYDQFGSTLHWGPYWAENRYLQTHEVYKSPDPNSLVSQFHVYGLTWSSKGITIYIDDPSNVVLSVPFNESFWQKGNFPSVYDNPWAGRPNAAPFDQEFYLLLNVAVGGTNTYFPDGFGKPWSNDSPHASLDFNNAKGQWWPTWKGEDSALQIDYVRVTAL
eukprot:TRINITY_DN3483_c0_g1_i2.p1 TRINITY_DN3483_c0_g1~~TRINITY_DN3483_c0_g1_i2.p1  ORF type:complete len:390 (+),score=103.59 TRINITY_DN3483_c0_g1_i2:83-1252(+)